MQAIASGKVSERHILDAVGDNRYSREVLRRLVALQIVERSGLGGAADPFLYRVLRTPEEAAALGAVDPAQQKRLHNNEAKVLSFLASQSGFVLERTIRTSLGDNTGIGSALRRLVADERVVRAGRGGSAQPFTYRINEALLHHEACFVDGATPTSSSTVATHGQETQPDPELVAMPLSPAALAFTGASVMKPEEADGVVSHLWIDCNSPTGRSCEVADRDLLSISSPGEASEAETILDQHHAAQALEPCLQIASATTESSLALPPLDGRGVESCRLQKRLLRRPPPIDPSSEQVIFSDFESPDGVFHDSIFAF